MMIDVRLECQVSGFQGGRYLRMDGHGSMSGGNQPTTSNKINHKNIPRIAA